jgi:hypothetical protein
MQIDFEGRTSTMTRQELRDAATFFAESLMGPKLTPNIHLVIEFEKMDDHNGCVNPIDEGRHGPRMFELTLDPRMGKRKMLRVLAHEMVHVKQMARQELREFGDRGVAYWNKKKYKVSKANYIQYLFWPWEVEAFGLDRALVLCYNTFKIQNRK